ncbi:hypothetical protein [Wenzhouxiangella sp. EGI_FJ10305]|uniref:hypothetical protein n=1 Tax=Wenzhouxiangella sp. EGI_FJ10305 TaxID=3243768 RepID=UPI0035D83770
MTDLKSPRFARRSILTLLGSLGLVLVLIAPVAAQHEMHDEAPVGVEESIGTVDFRADCTDEARAAFDRALALMHHMMYEQARGEFEAIADAQPDCAMAHWGIATTLFQPLWGTTPSSEAIERGRNAVERAHQAVDSEREQRLIEATAAFFEPETDKLRDRLPGWIEAIAEAFRAHPDDLDIAALYGLSLLTEAQRADNAAALHDEAESVLAEVWRQEPTHPGAVHYTIHATDADGRAENALDIVASYGEIAPNVPHALHMPSHIYVRLGDWPAVVDWNERSAEAALEHQADGALSFHYIHAIDYLVYGHLQRGEDSRAKSIRDAAWEKHPHQGNFPGAFHLAAVPARLAVERRDWQTAAAIEPRVPDYIAWDDFYWPEGMSWFARGLGAVHVGDLEAAREARRRLARLAEEAESAADARFSVYIEVDRRILDGFIAHAEGDAERALELMRSAGELESSVEKHPVTPGALYPPYEALGELLLALDRPDEALAEFERSDKDWPGRYNTLIGAVRAARAGDDRDAAQRWAERLLEVAPAAERRSIHPVRKLAGGD